VLPAFSTIQLFILASASLALTACSPNPPRPAPPDPLPAATLAAEGETLYSQACAMCHFAGEGGDLAPALRGAPSVTAQDPAALIDAVLQGRINQSATRPGIMPAQAYLTDREIASILTYIRREFGGPGDPVQPAAVFKRRER